MKERWEIVTCEVDIAKERPTLASELVVLGYDVHSKDQHDLNIYWWRGDESGYWYLAKSIHCNSFREALQWISDLNEMREEEDDYVEQTFQEIAETLRQPPVGLHGTPRAGDDMDNGPDS